MPTNRPDDDKTNPDPALIHQTFGGKEDKEAFEQEPMDLSAFEDDLPGDAIDLYDPIGINNFEDDIETSRTEPGLGLMDRTELYPDEFLFKSNPEPESVKELSQREAAIEEFYGGSTAFDPSGDEGEPEETRPLNNTEDDDSAG